MIKKEFSVENEHLYDHRGPVRWIFSHLARFPQYPIIAFIMAVINNWAFGNIQLYIGKGIGIFALPQWLLKDLFFIVLIVVGSAFLQGLTGLIRNFVFEFLAQNIEKNTRDEFYLSLLGKSQTFHGRQKIGDIMARATNDVKNLNFMFNPGVMLIIDSGLAVVIPFIMIGFIHPMLLIVPAIFVFFLILTVIHYNQRLKPVSFKQRDQFGKMNAGLAEAIEGIEVVKSNIQEKYEWKKFTSNAKIFKEYVIQQGVIQAKYWPMLVFAVCWGLAFFHALWLWKNQVLSLGQVVGFMGLFNTFRFVTFISLFSFQLVQLGLASAGRILNMINQHTDLDENSQGLSKPLQGSVIFNQVDFSYSNKKILENISFQADPGLTIAIVGQTGSGKTTLTRLINRIFDAEQGEVLIDSIDIKDWSLESLRSQISTIEQDIFLYSKTIRDNIAFGNKNASEQEIIEAAQKAQAHDFIMNFKDQYDTLVGERGVMLSGGQKQRIAIARAFLSNPRVLILDDSTSAIDSETEDKIQLAMKMISSKRTTFIITHRLSQIRWADKVILLKRGKVIDQGSHEELMERSEDYRCIFLRDY